MTLGPLTREEGGSIASQLFNPNTFAGLQKKGTRSDASFTHQAFPVRAQAFNEIKRNDDEEDVKVDVEGTSLSWDKGLPISAVFRFQNRVINAVKEMGIS